MRNKAEIMRLSPAVPVLFTVIVLTLVWLRLWEGGTGTGAPRAEMMPLEVWLRDLLEGKWVFSGIVWTSLTALNGILLCVYSLRNMLVRSKTFLPLMLYTVAASLAVDSFEEAIIPALAATLTIAGTMELASSFTRATSFRTSFRAAIFLGTAPLFFAPSVVYVLLVPIGMSLFRRSGKESFVALLAVLLPCLVCAYVMWSLDHGFTDVFRKLYHLVTVPPRHPFTLPGDIPGYIFTGACGIYLVLGVISIISYFASMQGMRTRAYKNGALHVFLFLISAAGFFLPGSSAGQLVLSAIPTAILPIFYFGRYRGWIPLALFILIIASGIACQAVYLLW